MLVVYKLIICLAIIGTSFVAQAQVFREDAMTIAGELVYDST